MEVIEKSRFDFRFHFGRHETRGDAMKIASDFNSFRPHIFVKENAGLLEPLRKGQISSYNNWITRVRKDGTKKKDFMAEIARKGDQKLPGGNTPNCGEFGSTAFEAVIDAYRCSLHFVEGYSEKEMEGLRDADEKYFGRGNKVFYDALLSRNPESSLLVHETSLRELGKNYMSVRDARTLEGISRMQAEVPELFPHAAGAPMIRVLVAYGAGHMNVAALLGMEGFNASVSHSLNDPYTLLMAKLSGNPGAPVSREEIASSIFFSLYEAFLKLVGMKKEAADTGLEVSRLLERIGTQRFLDALFAAAKKAPKPAELIREIAWLFA